MDCLHGQNSSGGNARLCYPSAHLFSNLHFSHWVYVFKCHALKWWLSTWRMKLLLFLKRNNLFCLSNINIREKWNCLWSYFNGFREFPSPYSLRAIKPDSFQPSNDSCGAKSLYVFHAIQLSYNGYAWLFPLQRDPVQPPLNDNWVFFRYLFFHWASEHISIWFVAISKRKLVTFRFSLLVLSCSRLLLYCAKA